jgi:hypothetical protein
LWYRSRSYKHRNTFLEALFLKWLGMAHDSNNYSNGWLPIIAKWEHEGEMNSFLLLGRTKKAFQNC